MGAQIRRRPFTYSTINWSTSSLSAATLHLLCVRLHRAARSELHASHGEFRSSTQNTNTAIAPCDQFWGPDSNDRHYRCTTVTILGGWTDVHCNARFRAWF
jgi:hypothetical protein